MPETIDIPLPDGGGAPPPSAGGDGVDVVKTSPLFDLDFDPAALDPIRLTMPGDLPRPAAPAPVAPAAEGTVDGGKSPKEEPKPVELASPTGKPEPVNFKQLKELRKKAEEERDQFKSERDALAAKVAELEPRTSTFESERKALREELEAKAAALAEKEATLYRTSVRESPRWKEKADAIRGAAAEVERILNLPVIREGEVRHGVATLLDPAARTQLNETIRVLQDGGHVMEANDLIEAHRSVNAWRGQLREIEEESAAQAKAWGENRDGLLASTLSAVRSQVSKSAPIHDERSAEFLALGEEDRKILSGHHEMARTVAARAVGLKPEELAAQTYVQTLEVRLRAQAQAVMGARIAALEKELEESKGKLSAYERAAGGGSVGGGRTTAPGEGGSLEDEALMLDPRNMPGYKGMG